MQDRFKFRTWILDLECFTYWGWVKDGEYKTLCSCRDISKDEQLLEKYTQQCTGLKDKNGKLIYEGDIVEFKFGNESRNGKVEYSQTIWSISNAEFVNRDYVGGALINLYRNCEVIGNIYENPELLKEENNE